MQHLAPAEAWVPHHPLPPSSERHDAPSAAIASAFAYPLPQPQPLPRPPPSHVTSALPTKRITFYRSGDSQFGGVKMAVHRRSFKCFDALLDDLSQKVPLPFGVRTVTTPRGTHAVHQLDQLQDGGCYLCSDRRCTKPVDMELAARRTTLWHPPHHHHGGGSSTPGGQHPRQQRRGRVLLLVRNGEPGRRRSVALGGLAARSLRAFLEEASDAMQFHVRRLYTVEGRKIDSLQSLMTCPGLLVCVGREPFSPMLGDFIRRSPEDRLPGLATRTPGTGARSPATQGARSRGSEGSEGHDQRKNVNFGPKTKKSIIHPRSDSSTRSTRFSVSSEKSYPNGLTPCSYSHARPAIVNDDIEKRVLLNKDGSLSVEMKVRFRLQCEDTIRWSTHIKKSASNCCPSGDNPPGYLQQGGQSETCSDPDSGSCDPEAANIFSGASLQRPMEVDNCPCCHQRREQQQYDLWENPMHSNKHAPMPPPDVSKPAHARLRQTHSSSSSSSSCHLRRVVCQRSRLSSSGGGSGLEQARVEVQEELCVTEEVCTVSRCHSSSNANGDDNGGCEQADAKLVLSDRDGKRPLSVISNSSNILPELQEYQDDEEEELPPSVSQCCQCEPSPTLATLTVQEEGACGSKVSSCHCGSVIPDALAQGGEVDRAARSKSKTSMVSCRSGKTKTPCSNIAPDQQDNAQDRVMCSLSRHRKLLSDDVQSDQSSVCSHCAGCKGTATPLSAASQRSSRSHADTPKPNPCLSDQGDNHGSSGDERTPSPMSEGSESSVVSLRSNKSNLTYCTLAMSNVPVERGASAMSQASIGSGSPGTSGKTLTEAEADCQEGAVRVALATSHKFSSSHKLGCSRGKATDMAGNSSASAMSAKSNMSTKSCISHKSTKAAEERVDSVLSCQSRTSNHTSATEGADKSEGVSERAASALSETAQSEYSAKSTRSHASRTLAGSSLLTNGTATGNGKVEVEEEETEETLRPISILSAKTAVSAKSTNSTKSHCSHRLKVEAPDAVTAEDIEELHPENGQDSGERAATAMSTISHLSVKSRKSGKSARSNGSLSPKPKEMETETERATSAMSAKSAKSVTSVSNKSVTSSKHHCNNSSMTPTPCLKVVEAEDLEEGAAEENAVARSGSVMSTKSAKSAKSAKSSKSGCAQVTTPGSNSHEVDKDVVAEKEVCYQDADRAASTMSAKSVASVRSSKSHKSNCNCNGDTEAPIIRELDTEAGKPAEAKEGNDERVSSALSVKSAHSSRSVRSHKSACVVHVTAASQSAQTPTQTPPSPGHPALNPGAVQSTTRQVLVDMEGEAGARGQSALSTRSTTSAKSKCHCGASLNSQKREEERNEEKEGEEGDTRVEEETESQKAPSLRSTKSKGLRQNLGGTDQPLDSMDSVSLVLPEEEQGDSDDRESHVASCKDLATSTHAEEMDESTATDTVAMEVDLLHAVHKPTDIPIIKTPGESEGSQKVDEQAMERSQTAVSTRNNLSVKSSRSIKSTSNTCVTALSPKPKREQNNESEGVKSRSSTKVHSSKGNHLEPSDNRSMSEMPVASSKGRSKSPVRASAAHRKEGSADVNTLYVKSKTPSCLRPNSAVSTASSTKQNALTPGPKGHNVVKSDEVRSNSGSEISMRTSRSNKESCDMRISQPAAHVENTGESALFHSLSAADLLKETTESTRSISRQSRGSDKTLGSQSGCQRIQKHKEKEREPTPAWLPKASPNEVISNWLQSIPADGCMFVDEDEMADRGRGRAGEKAIDEVVPSSREEESPQDKNEDEVAETMERGVEVDEEEEKKEDKETDGDREKAESAKEVQSSDLGLTPSSNEINSSDHKPMFQHSVSLSRNCHSSVALMKVLLSPSLGRSNSLPEVSPVYGRKLSTSAKDLLDCLAQLRLIEPLVSSKACEVHKEHGKRCHEVIGILQSLWIAEPTDMLDPKDQITPPRSSSGVGMGSCSGGSGKENNDGGGGEEILPKKEEEEAEAEAAVVAAVVTEEGDNEHEELQEADVDTKAEETGVTPESQEPSTGPEAKAEDEPSVPAREDANGSTGGPSSLKDDSAAAVTAAATTADTTPSSSDKSSSAVGSSKSPTDYEREMETLGEDSSSGTPPTLLRAPLAKRVAAAGGGDPDPMWALNLLRKLEKQFMGHYTQAMVEFKARWDLEDNVLLDTMISELRDEVGRRIQNSVGRELKKIQGRAGRSPRPPLGNLSRESTMTERRRQMLKIMKNQSVKTADSLSDGETMGEFSDQRSDDEYCPCDACVRKKLAARPPRMPPAPATPAPLMMEFDLRKILQLKKDPEPVISAQHAVLSPPEGSKVSEGGDPEAENKNLEVLQEEEAEEESKKDLVNHVLVETIPEEKEEEETGEGEGETEIGAEADGEVVGTEGEGEQEEMNEGVQEGECKCHCQCAGEEEEEEEGEEEEESASAEVPPNEEVDVEREAVNCLPHQCTRSSMESQLGSMEDLVPPPPSSTTTTTKMSPNGVSTGEGVMGCGQRRSRSPAQVKR